MILRVVGRQLDVGRVIDGVLAVGGERLVAAGVEVQDVDAVQAPAARGGAVAQLRLGLRQADEEARLAPACPFHEELHGQGRLARAGDAPDHVVLAGQQAAVEDLIQAPDPGR